jgi:hypothetical protein
MRICLDCRQSEKLPAQKLGGLYKNTCTGAMRLWSSLSLPFTVNRVLRDGEGRGNC